MATILVDDLLRLMVKSAIDDRESFLDAVGRNTSSGRDTRNEIARIRALEGKSMREALQADREAVFLAALSAECWYSSLADAQHEGAERRDALSKLRSVKTWRLRRFGRTRMEEILENSEAVPVEQFLGASRPRLGRAGRGG